MARARGQGVLSAGPLEIVTADPRGRDALRLLREAAIEARELYPELHEAAAPWPTNPPTPPGGAYLLGYAAGRAAACGALRPLSATVAEVRRMYVTRSARRRGYARAMLEALEVCARKLGYRILRLETGNKQIPAMALYESCGFHRIAPFAAYAEDPTSICFEKGLCHEPDCSDA